jgi:hypothetical protein
LLYQAVPKPDGVKPRSNSNVTNENQDNHGPVDLEYAPIKSIQLIEEDIQDFGAWKILLSGESVRHLRQFRRADQQMFGIVRKKMKSVITRQIYIHITYSEPY